MAENNEAKKIDFMLPESKDLQRFKGRLVLTVELTFTLEAPDIQFAEDLMNYHELRIQNAQWLSNEAHPCITNITESL